jgi:hypothetical protein
MQQLAGPSGKEIELGIAEVTSQGKNPWKDRGEDKRTPKTRRKL